MATRVRIVLPDDTLAELDQVVGNRHRSAFIAEAINEKLQRIRRINAMTEALGTTLGDDFPKWSSVDDVSAWLRDSRQNDVERITQAWQVSDV